MLPITVDNNQIREEESFLYLGSAVDTDRMAQTEM